MERNNGTSVIRISSFPTVIIKHEPQFPCASSANISESWTMGRRLRIKTLVPAATPGGNNSVSCCRRVSLKNEQPSTNERCESATMCDNHHLPATDRRLQSSETCVLDDVRESVTLRGAGRRVRSARVAAGVRLCVVGDGAVVRVGCNEGEVRVVGAGGRVRVRCNARGRVAYVGEGGDVRAGAGGRVSCAGAGTRVDDARACACCAGLHASTAASYPTAKAVPFVYVAHKPAGQTKTREFLACPMGKGQDSVSVHMSSFSDWPGARNVCLVT